MQAAHKNIIADLYQQMYRMLFAYARSALGDNALAEEAVQDTFCIACRRAEALCESTNPAGWLVNTLKFVVSNMVRKKNIAIRILADYYEANRNELCITYDNPSIRTLYGNLADSEDFRLVKAWAVDGASYEELAREHGISPAACRKRMQRAKEILRKKIVR